MSLPGASGATQTPSPWGAVMRRLQAATIGEFDIKRELGRGGMAAVYLAHDIALDLKVAIKVMAPGLMTGEGMIERFRLEAVTIAKLSHPNIVRVHALRQAAEDLHFIVMQYIPGRTLERIVRETGPLPIAVVRTLVGQVARALAYAHKRGVIHRDIKPGNIMLDATGDAVVTDFGIAKVAAAGTSHTLTGSVVGTPAYMSPEQCFARALTGGSDQYSLGIVAFEMLTGQVPFTGASYTVMHGHTHGEIPSIRELRPGCPPDLEATVRRMLAKNPEERFPSIADVATEIGATPLGEHDALRDELVQLAAVEESSALDALYPTPHSPIPQTRSSRVPVATPSAPAPASPAPDIPAPATPTPPAPAARTLVDPGPLDPARPPAEPREPTRADKGPAGVPSRRSIVWVAAVALAAAGGIALLSRGNADSESRRGSGPSRPDSIVPSGPASGSDGAVVATIRIANVPLRIAVGDTFTLTANVTGSDTLRRTPIVWRSGAPSIIRMDSGGRAVAVREGTATVLARRGTVGDSVEIRVVPGTVTPAPYRLVIAPPTPPVQVTDRLRLRAQEVDARGTRRPAAGPVTWSSGDPTVATVGAGTGELVALSAGRVVVSARTTSGRSTLAITIEPRPTPPTADPGRPKQDSVVTPPPPPPRDPPRERPPATKSPAELRSELDESVRSYARAIEAEDLARLRSLYPAITSAQSDGFRAFFDAARDIRLAIERIDAPAQLSATPGSEARVRVQYRIEYFNTSLRRPAREDARWDATLERTATGWRIQSIR